MLTFQYIEFLKKQPDQVLQDIWQLTYDIQKRALQYNKKIPAVQTLVERMQKMDVEYLLSDSGPGAVYNKDLVRARLALLRQGTVMWNTATKRGPVDCSRMLGQQYKCVSYG